MIDELRVEVLDNGPDPTDDLLQRSPNQRAVGEVAGHPRVEVAEKHEVAHSEDRAGRPQLGLADRTEVRSRRYAVGLADLTLVAQHTVTSASPTRDAITEPAPNVSSSGWATTSSARAGCGAPEHSAGTGR